MQRTLSLLIAEEVHQSVNVTFLCKLVKVLALQVLCNRFRHASSDKFVELFVN